MAWELYIITKSLLTISNPGCGCQNICTQLKMHPINAISEQQNSRQLKTNTSQVMTFGNCSLIFHTLLIRLIPTARQKLFSHIH